MLSQFRKSILWILLFVVSASCYTYAHDRSPKIDEYYEFELIDQSDIYEYSPVTEFSRSNSTGSPRVEEVSYITKEGRGWAFGEEWRGLNGYDEDETPFTEDHRWTFGGDRRDLNGYDEDERQFTDTITVPPWTSVSVILKKKWQYSRYRGYRVEVYWCYEHNTYEYERVYLGDKDWKDMWTEVWYVEHELLRPV